MFSKYREDGYTFNSTLLGTYYFVCGVEQHCEVGKQKAKIHVSKNCGPNRPYGDNQTIEWKVINKEIEICIRPDAVATFKWEEKNHNVNKVSAYDYERCSSLYKTEGET